MKASTQARMKNRGRSMHEAVKKALYLLLSDGVLCDPVFLLIKYDTAYSHHPFLN